MNSSKKENNLEQYKDIKSNFNCELCCMPCLLFFLSLEKCFQASCLCCCQILACECKTTASEKVSNK